MDRDDNPPIHCVKVGYRFGAQEQTPLEGFESSGADTVLAFQLKYDHTLT